ncbi:hypothetical protein ACF0H5_022407 [Mactra antiquata]
MDHNLSGSLRSMIHNSSSTEHTPYFGGEFSVDNTSMNASYSSLVSANLFADNVTYSESVGGLSSVSNHPVLTSDELMDIVNKTQFQILTPSLILVCVLMIIGIPGNLIALLVYLTKMKRNAASYFIITLAISDLINCTINLPVEIVLITNFTTFDIPWLCKFTRFLTAAMNNTSSFILAAIAVERFRSICRPLKPRMSSILTKSICVALTTCAILSAVPMIWGYGTATYTYSIYNVTVIIKTCLIDDAVKDTSYPNMLLIIFFVGHIVIFIILAVLYGCIAKKLLSGTKFSNSDLGGKGIFLQRQSSSYSIASFTMQSRTSLRNLSTDSEQPLNGKRKLLRSTSSQSNIEYNLTRKHGGHNVRTKRLTFMLFLVTSVFEISFIPYLVIVCLRNHNPLYYDTLSVSHKMAFQFFLRSYLINCALNPVIYCFYNQNFRHGVKRLFYSIKEFK